MTAPIEQLQASRFHGQARAMSPADVAVGARRLGCEQAMIDALLDVESSGHGFDAAGRPKLLPERHIFYRRLAGTPALAAAVNAGVAYPTQGAKPYPGTSDGCYALLSQMTAIAPLPAIASCSWGIAQVMGFNFACDGYDDPAAMVLACLDSEAAQFGLMLGYLEKNDLVGAVRRRDFLAIATGYNGRGAAASYAAHLQAAYLHHAGANPAPAKLAAPALCRPPAFPNQLASAAWLAVRSGSDADHSADDLNAAELARIHGDLA